VENIGRSTLRRLAPGGVGCPTGGLKHDCTWRRGVWRQAVLDA